MTPSPKKRRNIVNDTIVNDYKNDCELLNTNTAILLAEQGASHCGNLGALFGNLMFLGGQHARVITLRNRRMWCEIRMGATCAVVGARCV